MWKNSKGRYKRKKQRTTVAISPMVHTIIKQYAMERDLRLEDAVEELLKMAFARIEGLQFKPPPGFDEE